MQVLSNFAKCVSGSDPSLPKNYDICTMLVILGATSGLAIIMGSHCGGKDNGDEKGNDGGRGVRKF